MADNNEQELAMKFQMFEQQIRMLQEQLQAVEQAIVELGSLNLGLDELIGKKDNEILAPVGRGIYAKANLISEELLVDIGNKNFVTKSIPETKKILQEQIKKLEKIREELNIELEKINAELTDVFIKSQVGLHRHSHGENCECEEECVCDEEGCSCEGECKCEKTNKKNKQLS
ncbi:MAG: prefoldin subunit alpha [Nanoarchaeota archaeon]